jgi:Zn-dependent protease
MSWEEREHARHDRDGHGRPGGDWLGLRPTFDKPWTWSIPIARLAGITIRVHIVFVLYIIIMLLQSQPWGGATNFDFSMMARAMGLLFIVVLAHECGHCLVCRLIDGRVDEILMWPLGGLALCDAGPRWKSHLLTSLGGPIVNLILCVICTSLLASLNPTQWRTVAIPNPLDPMATYLALKGDWQQYTLAMINEISLIMLLFNLMPIFPLDGGRIVQSALWPRFGYSRSMLIAVHVGYVGAMLLGIYGAVVREWTVVAVALFGGITCYNMQKQLQWSDSAVDFEADEYVLSPHGRSEPDPGTSGASESTQRERQAERRALREQQEAREVDRILQKIGESGMASLSRAERALLHRVTERKRHER